jgi:CRISPR-associated protein Cmr1
MSELKVTLKTVTPLFLGGANPNDSAELRPPSIKGALRFWYRALDKDYQAKEPLWFGSTDSGQSPCMIYVVEPVTGVIIWDKARYQFNIDFQQGKFRNGINYLGYSLALGKSNRKAIPQGTALRLAVVTRPSSNMNSNKAMRQAWAASLWLLGTLGGLGSRSRRGLGTVALVSWEGWDETSSLPVPHTATSPEAWLDALRTGMKTLRLWFPERPAPDHSVLDENCQIFLLKKGLQNWEQALNAAGSLLQNFRQRGPDYSNVKAHVARRNALVLKGVTPQVLKQAPERTTFGLPLEFRFTSLSGASVKFVGTEHDRMASPLWIRIVQIGSLYHPLFISLNTQFLGPKEGVTDKKGPEILTKPTGRILDDFLNTIIKLRALPEVRP